PSFSAALPAIFPTAPPSLFRRCAACLPTFVASLLPSCSSFPFSSSGPFRTAYVAARLPRPAAAGTTSLLARLPLESPVTLSLASSATSLISGIRLPPSFASARTRPRVHVTRGSDCVSGRVLAVRTGRCDRPRHAPGLRSPENTARRGRPRPSHDAAGAPRRRPEVAWSLRRGGTFRSPPPAPACRGR